MRARSAVRTVACGSVLLAVAGGCRHPTAPAPSGSAASGKGEFKGMTVTASPPRPIGSEVVRGRKFPVVLNVSETNLTLEPVYGAPRKFSYESWAEWSFRKELVDAGAADAGASCVREIKVTPVSWLEPLLALRESIYQSCAREAHPGGETRLTTLWTDMNEHSLGSPRPVLLTELYDAAVIAEALRGDALVQRALKGRDVPEGLDALVRALAETPPVIEGKRCYSFPEDLMSRFVLHHEEGEKVAVRLGLPGAGPCRYELTELGLLLPRPTVLEPAFEAAKREPELKDRSFFVVDRPEMAKTAIVRATGAP